MEILWLGCMNSGFSKYFYLRTWKICIWDAWILVLQKIDTLRHWCLVTRMHEGKSSIISSTRCSCSNSWTVDPSTIRFSIIWQIYTIHTSLVKIFVKHCKFCKLRPFTLKYLDFLFFVCHILAFCPGLLMCILWLKMFNVCIRILF